MADELRLAEYKSVRDEWLASRDAQQHTLQWRFAASVLLIAGILSAKNKANLDPFLYVALTAAVAALSVFSQAVWFGEVVRMERASLFLRGLEAQFRRLPRKVGQSPPLMWETWRGNEPSKESDGPWIRPAYSSIFGGFALFGLLTFSAVTILGSVAFDDSASCANQELAGVLGVLALALYFSVTIDLGRKAMHMNRHKGDAPEFE